MKGTFVVWVEGKVKEVTNGRMNYQDVKYTQLSNKTEGDGMAAKYHPLPQYSGDTQDKSCCCGLSHRKVILATIIAVLVVIIGLYTVCRPSDKPVVNYKDILSDNDYNMPRHRLPHCIIIGMRKGGTRALLQFLNLHPNIQVSSKEVHYFDRNEHFFQGISWYRKNLPLSYGDQITIEKTPGYFHSDKSPERIFRMNSTIKLILLVRDPIERAMSDHLQLMDKRSRMNLETTSFEEKVLKDNGDVNDNYKPIQRSVYYQFMRHWLRFFQLEQIMIVDGKNLTKNPFEVAQKVESFLGLEHRISKDSFVFDRTKGFFCIKNETTGHKCLNRTKGRKHPEVDEEVLAKLKEYFEPYNKIFFEQIGQKFDW
ncbi:heparan sulfate glucosamine 3-O-sulfotransferase 1-like isoform X1 [Mytilus galloprovincialis]|uniref:heparan sulfate glucosamine 3-O-sulfotransferase 1-like isoform X1 n=1 Tax=Mytilus galloprovincialis TaxID=29158 RepID=UPI003F7BC7E8